MLNENLTNTLWLLLCCHWWCSFILIRICCFFTILLLCGNVWSCLVTLGGNERSYSHRRTSAYISQVEGGEEEMVRIRSHEMLNCSWGCVKKNALRIDFRDGDPFALSPVINEPPVNNKFIQPTACHISQQEEGEGKGVGHTHTHTHNWCTQGFPMLTHEWWYPLPPQRSTDWPCD